MIKGLTHRQRHLLYFILVFFSLDPPSPQQLGRSNMQIVSVFVALCLVPLSTAAPLIEKKINVYGQTKKYFQGDIFNIPLHPKKVRNGIKFDYEKWTNAIIPYTLGVAQNRRALVLRAINKIQVSSCIKFVERTTQTNYINIITTTDGCYSSVGMAGGVQTLSLQDDSSGSCMTYDTVIHELLHAVGLYHEQSRYDRDNYITIVTANIKAGYADQFDIVGPNDSDFYGTPFDYTSVMLYDAYAFSKSSGKTAPTILPKKAGMQDRIGTAQDASYYDLLKINRIYKCPLGGTGGTTTCTDTHSSNVCQTYRNYCNDPVIRPGCQKTCGFCS